MRGNENVFELEYGEYPKSVVPKEIGNILEKLYNSNSLSKTGKSYTTDSRNYYEYDKKFEAQSHIEYEYNGKKYVRVKARFSGNPTQLSNGEKYKRGDYVWVMVEPIKWLVDQKHDIAITKDIIVSGIQFKHERDYKGYFDCTDMYKFMDEYLSKDILNNANIRTNEDVVINRKRTNPYKFNFDNVDEEEIIKGAVESDISVFLHGRSSEGKSARVKQLDPDCEIIYLMNASPDSLNGKSVYNQETGEMIEIPPAWYKKLLKRCEEEPDKIHIVFFDELTNARESIQGAAFNIILDKEINGIWKLPENARVVAAGNEYNESRTANKLAEPLFNRFAHVYINTTVEDWLKWAITPDSEYEKIDYKDNKIESKIHPVIYAFIAFKKELVLRSEYTGIKPNADPRKWEMASKMLYKCGKPEMLRALVGEEITKEFIEFCNYPVITLEDVINDRYNTDDLNMDSGTKWATVVGLSSCSEEHLEKVRKFTNKLGPELCATFDSLWTRGEINRIEKIQEIEISSNLSGGMKK